MKLLKVTAIAATIAVASIGAYWHYSPHLALHGMQAASKAKDADALNAYVDYPKLRESLKGQMAVEMAKAAKPDQGEMGDAAAAFGMMIVGPMIDAMVRPEFVMHAFNEANLREKSSEGGDEPAQKKDLDWSIERKTVDLVVVHVHDKNAVEVDTKPVGIVMERTGFASWKMTGISVTN